MSDIEITLSLPAELVERATKEGILNNSRVASWLQTEVERIERWRSFSEEMEPVRAAFRAEYTDMTEDEVIAMLNEDVQEVRAALYAKKHENSSGQAET